MQYKSLKGFAELLNKGEIVDPIEEKPTNEDVLTNAPEIVSEDAILEEDETLAFPNARIVKIMREEIMSGKQIRSEVKAAVNEWLGQVLRKVAKEMDKSPYGSIGIADFQRATQPFDMIEHMVADRERLLLSIEKLKSDADQIKRDMQRFYTTLTGIEQTQV